MFAMFQKQFLSSLTYKTSLSQNKTLINRIYYVLYKQCFMEQCL
jgi:hypothetical protein